MAWSEILDLACQGLTFFPPNYASWFLEIEEDVPLNIYAASIILLSVFNGRYPPFNEDLNWLQLSYTAYRMGDYAVSASTVLSQSAIEEGGELFPVILQRLHRLYTELYHLAVSLGCSPLRR